LARLWKASHLIRPSSRVTVHGNAVSHSYCVSPPHINSNQGHSFGGLDPNIWADRIPERVLEEIISYFSDEYSHSSFCCTHNGSNHYLLFNICYSLEARTNVGCFFQRFHLGDRCRHRQLLIANVSVGN